MAPFENEFYNKKYINLPASYQWLRQGPDPGQGIHDCEGDGGGQQEVWHGQVEDEDIPGCPHLLPQEDSGHHGQVTKN